MNKFKKIFLILALALGIHASALTLGVEYIKLNKNQQIPDANNEIIELFSYSCIHCYNHFKNGTLEFISELIPELKYEEWQVKQMGDFGSEMAEVLCYANMIDKENFIKNPLDKKSSFYKVLNAYFERYFKLRLNWNDSDSFYQTGIDILKSITKKDISIADIKSYAKSSKGKEYLDRTDYGFNIAKISGTPAFIIKGKYLLNLNNIKNEENLIEVIKELIKLD